MPLFEWITDLASSPEDVFEYLSRPTNLIEVSPPEFQMRLVKGPDVLALGAEITVEGKRWGVSQQIQSRVTAFEPPRLIIDEQIKGPFKKLHHTHRLEPWGSGTRMHDRIEYEAPGGMLGFVMTNARIEKDLREVFALRTRIFQGRFGGQ